MLTIIDATPAGRVPRHVAAVLIDEPAMAIATITNRFQVSPACAYEWRSHLRAAGLLGGEYGKTYLTQKEACIFLACSRPAFADFIARRGLPATTFADGTQMYERTALRHWANTVLPTIRVGRPRKEGGQ